MASIFVSRNFESSLIEPVSDYFKFRDDIDEPKRYEIMKWMIKITEDFGLSTDLYALSASFFDQYLSKTKGKLNYTYECLACSCESLASKLSQNNCIPAEQLKQLSGYLVENRDIIELEADVCKVIDFKFRTSTVVNFIHTFRNMMKTEDFSNIIPFLTYVTLANFDLINIRPDLMAVCLISIINDTFPYKKTRKYMGYTKDEFLDPMKRIIECLWSKYPNRSEDIIKLVYEKEQRKKITEFFTNFDHKHMDNYVLSKKVSFVLYHKKSEKYGQKTIEKLETKQVGKGEYGTVFAIKTDDKDVILKKYTSGGDNGVSTDFVQEVSVLTSVVHPNVVSLFDVGVTKERFITMEACELNLGDHIHDWDPNNTPEVLDQILDLTRQILKGLKYIHSIGLVHCDIKPGNILICNGVAKLCDFGISRWLIYFDMNELRKTQVYPIVYRAPEHLLNTPHIKTSSDIWAFGCVLYEMLTRELLFAPIPKPAPVSFSMEDILSGMLESANLVSEAEVLSSILDLLGVPGAESWPEFAKLCKDADIKITGTGRVNIEKINFSNVDIRLHSILANSLVVNPKQRSPANELLDIAEQTLRHI